MAIQTIYQDKTSLTGGTAYALDVIDGNSLVDGDRAYVLYSGALYVYRLNATSGAAESSPNVISPDTNAGTKRWILFSIMASTTVEISTTRADNDSSTYIATTAFAKSQDAVLAREPDQGVALTAAASGSSGITVADNDNLDFGSIYLMTIDSGDSRLRTILGATTRYSTATESFVDNSVHEIMATVSVGASSTTVTYYADGVQFGDAIVSANDGITSNMFMVWKGSFPDWTNPAVANHMLWKESTSDPLRISGNNSVRCASTTIHAYLGNFAPTAAEVLDMYRNGIPESWKWGSQTSIITGTDSTFAGASNWANVDINAYDETTGGVLTITASAANQYCTLPIANATTVAGKKYRIKYDVASLAATWTIKDFGGTVTIGTVSANGTGQIIEFTASTTGGLRLVAVANNSSGAFDNFLLYEIGATLALTSEGIRNGRWIDDSTNHNDATFPTSGWSLTRQIPNEPVLTNLLANSQWMAMSGSTLENVGSNLLTGWTPSGTWDTFTASGADITSAIEATQAYTCSAQSNTLLAGGGTGNGKLFKLTFNITLNSGTMPDFSIQNADTGDIGFTPSSGANTIVFERNMPNACTVAFYANNVPTNFSISSMGFYEVTPGYVAADTLAPDGWGKASDTDIYREHTGSNTKDGAYYAIKTVNTSSVLQVTHFQNVYALAEHIKKFAGRTVTLGVWAKTITASYLSPAYYDGSAWVFGSAIHTGSGNFEWLESTFNIPASITGFLPGFRTNGSPSSITAYFSQPMLVYGDHIGRGNYQPIVNEVLLAQSNIALTGYTATTSAVDGIINLEAASSGMVGKGVKAVLVKAYGKDSAAGDGVGFDVQSASGVEDGISVDTQVNNIKVQGQGWIKTDNNGDIYLDHRGSGAAALTLDIKVIGIQT